MAYCIYKHTPFWNYPLPLAFVFHLYRLCNISALLCQLLIVSNMQSTNVKQLCGSAEKYTIHRNTSLNHILRSQTSPIVRMLPPQHMYSIVVNYISYLKYFLAVDCKLYYTSGSLFQVLVVSNMDVKHVKQTFGGKKKPSSILISILWERGPSRNGKLRYTPFWKSPLPLADAFQWYELYNISRILF